MFWVIKIIVCKITQDVEKKIDWLWCYLYSLIIDIEICRHMDTEVI